MNCPKVFVREKRSHTQTCLFASMASAMHHFAQGKKAEQSLLRTAQILKSQCKKSENSVECISMMVQTMKSHCQELPVLQRHGDGMLDMLADVSDCPTTVVLCAMDSGTEHAIATVGAWIFDSSMERAMPLTKESLDWCCVNGFL